jgi:hypothetical protein
VRVAVPRRISSSATIDRDSDLIFGDAKKFSCIASGQARQSVANYKNGKQKRTKARKEKTEETKNLTAMLLHLTRRASPEKLPSKCPSEGVSGISKLAVLLPGPLQSEPK